MLLKSLKNNRTCTRGKSVLDSSCVKRITMVMVVVGLHVFSHFILHPILFNSSQCLLLFEKVDSISTLRTIANLPTLVK